MPIIGIHVFGQSNARGSALPSDATAYGVDGEYSKVQVIKDGELVSMSLANSDPGVSGWGIDLKLAQLLHANSGPDERFIIIKHGVGGSALWSQWRYEAPEAHPTWDTRKVEYYAKIAEAESLAGETIRHDVFIWYQGEADSSHLSIGIPNYQANELELIEGVLDDHGHAGSKWITVGINDPLPSPYDVSPTAQTQVNDSKIANAAANSQVTFFETKNLPYNADGIHLGASGISTLAQSIFDAIKSTVLKGTKMATLLSVSWGSIAGTITAQTDLTDYIGTQISTNLAGKANTTLSNVTLPDALDNLGIGESDTITLTGIVMPNTGSDDTDFEHGFVRWDGNTFRIGTEKGGTGSARDVRIYRDGGLKIGVSSTVTFVYTSVHPATDGLAFGTSLKGWRGYFTAVDVGGVMKTGGGIGAWGVTPPASQPAAIADLDTGTATNSQIATAVNSILAVLRGTGDIDT